MTEVAVETKTVTPTDDATASEQVSQAEPKSTETQAPSEVDKPKRRDGGFQRRIDQLTRDKYQLEAQLRAEREARERPAEQPKGEPQRAQFESYEDYLEAKANYAADRAAQKHIQTLQEQTRRQNAERQAQTLAESWSGKLEKARDDIEDYDDVVSGSSAPISREMTQAIMESDIGPQVVYHLAQHPEDAERIAKLSAASQAREIGRIEAALLAPKPKPKTVESKPIDPVGSGGSVSGGPQDKQGIKEWMASRNKQLGRG